MFHGGGVAGHNDVGGVGSTLRPRRPQLELHGVRRAVHHGPREAVRVHHHLRLLHVLHLPLLLHHAQHRRRRHH